ncbi:hypothetical protein, partial [Chromohalobacter sp. HP20-39]|uniref:hypothetical protein n=1 Tax=Chromohalobacter sp. HP20-39 TaxID=3079306 RepID=UPI00294B128E
VNQCVSVFRDALLYPIPRQNRDDDPARRLAKTQQPRQPNGFAGFLFGTITLLTLGCRKPA